MMKYEEVNSESLNAVRLVNKTANSFLMSLPMMAMNLRAGNYRGNLRILKMLQKKLNNLLKRFNKFLDKHDAIKKEINDFEALAEEKEKSYKYR